MILFVIYAAVVWSGAYFLRRKLLGIVIALLSPVPVAIGTWMLAVWLRQTQSTPTHILVVFPIAYGAVITAGAWFAALAKRLPRHPCLRCGYDLQGNLSGICPECGAPIGTTRTPEIDDLQEAMVGGEAAGTGAQAALAARRARARESTTASPSTSTAPVAATSVTNPQ